MGPIAVDEPLVAPVTLSESCANRHCPKIFSLPPAACWPTIPKTSQRYVTLLEQVFLVFTLRPWYTNTIKRIIKTAKLQFLDSGLLAASRGLTFDRLRGDRAAFGALLESYVLGEILKLMSWSDLRLTP